MQQEYADIYDCDNGIVFQSIGKYFDGSTTLSSPVSGETTSAMDFSSPPLYCVGFDSITTGKAKLKLAEPIVATIRYQNGMYFMENDDLNIIIMASNLDQCKLDFDEVVSFILKEYGEEDDSKLTKDAQELKKKILQYVKR